MLSTEGYSIPDIVKTKKQKNNKTQNPKKQLLTLSVPMMLKQDKYLIGSFGWSWRKSIYYLQILLKTIYSITSKSAHLE